MQRKRTFLRTQRSGQLFEPLCLLITSYRLQEPRIILANCLSEKMLSTQAQLPDAQSPLVERLGLLILALIYIQVRQIAPSNPSRM
jgi:hypothetical protein